MNNFSESYHLLSIDINDGVNLLKRAGLKGFVMPPVNGWVTISAEGESLVPNDTLTEANLGTLLHYIYVQKSGWEFSIYRGKEQASNYGCIWDEFLTVFDDTLNKDELLKLLGNDTSILQKILELLHPETEDEALKANPAENFAKLLGLGFFKGISYEYIHENTDEFKKLCPGLIAID